jgi:cold shock CspA family protein/ribosome-associated translation inhibitor RaiA
MEMHIEGRNLEILPEWREKIEEELVRMEEHYMGPVLQARVVLIGTRHHHLGAFEVHLTVSVSGDTLTIVRQGELIMPLLGEVFEALSRRLSEHSRVKQQEVKSHEKQTLHGKVSRLFPEGEYGFIEDQDGTEVYFHVNALKNGKFDKLTVGSEVKFVPEEGDKGLQAVWVQPLK